MAESPAHKFGQEIGKLLERILQPPLMAFCESRGLYLDTPGVRVPARKGKKVTWVDKFGNSHDFDFVVERGGTDEIVGQPVAFIEAAWRRYTKHSKNKVQEIQGAVLPVVETHEWNAPFKGAVLAGEFTEASLVQLRSLGFVVLHISYDKVVSAFSDNSIDVRFDENTSDAAFQKCVDSIVSLTDTQQAELDSSLIVKVQPELDKFLVSLHMTIDRQLDFVAVIPLYGTDHRFESITDARVFIESGLMATAGEFRRYDIVVRFTNGDCIDASFAEASKAVAFLAHVDT